MECLSVRDNLSAGKIICRPGANFKRAVVPFQFHEEDVPCTFFIDGELLIDKRFPPSGCACMCMRTQGRPV